VRLENRRPSIAEAGVDHSGQIEHRPALASLAAARQVLMLVEKAAEGAEDGHR